MILYSCIPFADMLLMKYLLLDYIALFKKALYHCYFSNKF